MTSAPVAPDAPALSRGACWLILVTAFFGWFFAGVHLATTSLAMRDAAKDLLSDPTEALVGRWFGRLTAAFLCGAATGGFVLGRVGDRFGRSRAMAFSILCYSGLGGLCYFVGSPWQLLVLWFLASLGVGGMWPNGIALVSEAWPSMSRPFLAGAIGTAANLGIMLFSIVCCFHPIDAEHGRWVMLIAAGPTLLGAYVLVAVPESPKWLAAVGGSSAKSDARPQSVFRPPVLKATLLGIALGTVPMFGAWGSSNWANAWAARAGDKSRTTNAAATPKKPDPGLKARTHLARSLPGSISSLLGGATAVFLGRRRCYFLLSLGCLVAAQYLFWFLEPGQPAFLLWTAILGAFSGFYFGWLPLCLPELFPTRVRSTGAGIGFNFGRVLTAIGVLVSSELMPRDGNYALVGRITSLVYVAGMFVILFVPDLSQRKLDE